MPIPRFRYFAQYGMQARILLQIPCRFLNGTDPAFGGLLTCPRGVVTRLLVNKAVYLFHFLRFRFFGSGGMGIIGVSFIRVRLMWSCSRQKSPGTLSVQTPSFDEYRILVSSSRSRPCRTAESPLSGAISRPPHTSSPRRCVLLSGRWSDESFGGRSRMRSCGTLFIFSK